LSALFGFSSLQSQPYFQAIAFLAPLIIILPCWWIFFDKATTITRIVGYYRVLEQIIKEYPNRNNWFIGYETALALYRKQDDSGLHTKAQYLKFKNDKIKKFSSDSQRGIRHKYWLINWCTFGGLSLFCCITSLTFYKGLFSWNNTPILIGIVLLIWSAISTFETLRAVNKGKYSYNENTLFWKFILDPRNEFSKDIFD